MKRLNKEIVSWAFYDWANSAFATTIMAAVLPVYYNTVAASGLADTTAVSYWGYTQSIALLIVAVLSPILGAAADASHSKKRFLTLFAMLGIVASAAMAVVGQGDYLLASALTIIGTIGFSGANVFYDAFLPHITSKNRFDQISSVGFAFGYIGGGLLLLVNVLMITQWQLFGFPDKTTATQMTFVTVAIWWLLFSIPMFLNVNDRRPHGAIRKKASIRQGLKRLRQTFRELKNYPELFKFLIAYWLFNDGISTIIKMATIYGSGIGIGTNDLIAALLITQIIGIPCTFFIGWIAGKTTAKKTLMATLLGYTVIVILGYFMTTAWHFYLLAGMVGLVQGGAQALSRSLYSKMVPAERSAEFFGFYSISGKFSAIFGPFVFALTIQLTDSNRLGIVSLVIFFLIGMYLLTRVDVDKGEAESIDHPAA